MVVSERSFGRCRLRTLVRRVLTVVALLCGMTWVFQVLLTRDYQPMDRYALSIRQIGADGKEASWTFTVDHLLRTRIDSAPAGVADALGRIRSARGELKIEATDSVKEANWFASRDAAGRVRMDGNAVALEDVTRRIALDTAQRPTRPATIQDVLEANIPMPTRSKVSLPAFSYQQAFPGAAEAPEIVVTEYNEAPMLRHLRDANRTSADPGEQSLWRDWRKYYPTSLPPVAERMPRNPAVVVGCDGLGQYGGLWRRCVTDMFDFYTKLCTESFMKRDPSGNIQPCLAYRWESSPDNRVYTLYLRKGHRWSDGEPFTTEDILWTCNVVIGAGSFEPPDWMQARDGAQLLYEDDASDWPQLARRIVQEADGQPSVGGQIKALGSSRLWQSLQTQAAGGSASQPALAPLGINTPKALATADLNDLFRNPAFYFPQAFAHLDTDAELRELEGVGASRLDGNELDRLLLMLERRDILRKVRGKDPNTMLSPSFRDDPNSPTQSEVIRLNLLLFRSAYADLVVPPAKDRVRVEAVPDETGDTSHIIRFTFRKPNSLFIEHTPTFMFYRFLSTSKHATMSLRPQGSKVLAVTDFLDWRGFVKALRQQAQDRGNSLGKRLWMGQGESTRQRLQRSPPTGDSDDGYKKEIVDAVNKVLSSRGFYDKEAFAGIDLAACRKQMHHNGDENREMGCAEVFRDASQMAEYRNRIVVEDLQRRADREGTASLSDEENQVLGVALFRAAYSADTQKPLIAQTRTAGLDEAARNHPLKYDSWSARADDVRNYHPAYNPHPPVLAAWRIVSQKEDPEFLAVRNPYYYKVDAAGNQLPYIDAVRTSISAEKQIRILKMTGGNIDCQSQEITFEEYPVLKQNEENGDYEVRLWPNDYCGEVCYAPIQAHRNPMFAKANEDPNFRYALSLALNRQEMIDVVFFGMGSPAQFSIPKGSPYYSESLARQYIEYDPNRANRLLDAMGLDQRDDQGFRRYWDGTSMLMDVNTTKELVPLQAVQLACVYWQKIGINAQLKIRTNSMIYRLEELGDCDVEVSKEGGNYFGPFPPGYYYPSHPAESTQWYQWANYMRNGGRSGWPPPERIKELERMWQVMVESPDEKGKMAAWKAITDRCATDLPVISIMTSPGKIILVKNGFKNVPKIALAGWIAHEPGNACPECFFFDHNYRPPLRKKH
jgi:ABC-type transport system substrate-binding protein